MPRWDNNELDDQPVWDATADFRGGMNTTVLPHLLGPNQYAKGVNTLLLKTGRIRTRGGLNTNGQTSPAAITRGMCFFNAATDKILMAVDSKLSGWDNSTFATIAGYTLTGQVSAFQAQSRAIFCSDGGAEYYNGTTVHTLNVADLPVLTLAGTGYVVGDLLTLTGGTPDVAAVIRVATVGGSGEILTVDFGTGSTRGLGYATAPTGFTGGSGSGATFTYSISTTPTGKIALWHTERLFKNDTTATDTLHVSDILEPGYFPTTSQLTIGSDGDPITGLHSWDNFNLLVFKENSTYLVEANPQTSPSAWSIHKISSTTGCVSHWTTVQVGADVWWLSREGVKSVRRLLQETQREISDSVSTPIQSYIDNISWGSVETACMAYHDNKVLLSIPTGVATEPDKMLVYDTYHQVWVSEWTPAVGVMAMATSVFLGVQRLHFGTDVGECRVYVDSDEVDTDAVAAETVIATEIWLRAFNFGDPVSPKSPLNIELEFSNSTATLDLSLSFDGDPFLIIADDIASSIELLTLPFTLPASLSDGGRYRRAFNLLRYRQIGEAQPKITSASARVSVRSLVMSAFVETMRIEY